MTIVTIIDYEFAVYIPADRYYDGFLRAGKYSAFFLEVILVNNGPFEVVGVTGGVFLATGSVYNKVEVITVPWGIDIWGGSKFLKMEGRDVEYGEAIRCALGYTG